MPEETFLSRDTVDLAAVELQRFFDGKTVLVTGAGGSIGSELAAPARARATSAASAGCCCSTPRRRRSTTSTARCGPSLGDRAVAVLASVRDRPRMAEVLESGAARRDPARRRPQARAPVRGATRSRRSPPTPAATCAPRRPRARSTGVANFTLVSTDKAVAPSCVMGATKRAAETYVQSLAARLAPRASPPCASATCSGSNGSVLPLFHEQIARGGPVTVTDPRATRFFMTIPEACGLILQATRIGRGRRGLHPRHGRAGARPGPRPQPHPPLRLRAGQGHRGRDHRPAARREAAREPASTRPRKRRARAAREAAAHPRPAPRAHSAAAS